MAGAFGSYMIVNAVTSDGAHPPWYGVVGILVLGLSSGAAVGAAVAYLLERVAYRPLRKRGAPKLAFLISAIGASFFLSQFAGKMFNRLTSNGSPAFFEQEQTLSRIFGAQVKVLQLVIIVAAVLMMIFLDRLVSVTKLGRSIRAVSEDAQTAALMGINIDKTNSPTLLTVGPP